MAPQSTQLKVCGVYNGQLIKAPALSCYFISRNKLNTVQTTRLPVVVGNDWKTFEEMHEQRKAGIGMFGEEGLKLEQLGEEGLELEQLGEQGLELEQLGEQGLELEQLGEQGLELEQLGEQGLELEQLGEQGLELEQLGKQGLKMEW